MGSIRTKRRARNLEPPYTEVVVEASKEIRTGVRISLD